MSGARGARQRGPARSPALLVPASAGHRLPAGHRPPTASAGASKRRRWRGIGLLFLPEQQWGGGDAWARAGRAGLGTQSRGAVRRGCVHSTGVVNTA